MLRGRFAGRKIRSWQSHRAFSAGKSPSFPLTSLRCGALLQAFAGIGDHRPGLQLHAHAHASGVLVRNTYLATKLCAFYAACGRVGDARVLFDGVTLKCSFLWNAMLRGYARGGSPLEALALYREMLETGRTADKFTYPFVLMACGDLLLVGVGRRVHGAVVVVGLESDLYVGNSLLSMYCKFGEIDVAWKLFDQMPRRDLISWNTMISGCTRNGEPMRALLLLSRMGETVQNVDCATLVSALPACAELGALNQGKEIHGYCVRNFKIVDGLVSNALISVYGNSNFMTGARCLFERMSSRDVVSWNSLISGYVRNGDAFEALRLFHRLRIEHVMADEITVVAVLRACDQLAALQLGESLHACIIKQGFSEGVVMGTALITLYAKCGKLNISRRIFDDMSEKTLVSWSAMVSAYGLHGRGMGAVSVFKRMKSNGIKPDKVVFTSVLSACSHSGLVEEGRDIFDQMLLDASITPSMEHYSCMVDLFGRAGRLEEAYEFIKDLKARPNIDVWVALLSACRVHHNVPLAEIAAENVFHLNPKDVGVYVSLSNIYAKEKRWDDVERIRKTARQNGLRKSPGCSFVELGNTVHQFLVGDRAHPQAEYIYKKLEDLRLQLREAGYIPDTSFVLYDVEEEVKEKMLWDHSERLAIAFALLKAPPQMHILITKNLRVCGDCHTVTKLISKIVRREIVVRDARRFHHFKDGHCSCADYW